MGFFAGEANQLVGPDITAFWNGAFFQHFVRGVVFEPRDEIDFPVAPLAEQGVVVIATIHRDDGAGVERKSIGHLHIAAPGFGDQNVGRQVVVVVQRVHAPSRPLWPDGTWPRGTGPGTAK